MPHSPCLQAPPAPPAPLRRRALTTLTTLITLSALSALSALALSALALSAPSALAQPAPDELGDSPAPQNTAPAPQNTAPAPQGAQLKVDQVPAAVESQPKRGDEVYQRQISQIEAQVNELKEEIFRSRTRLSILKETVLAIGLSGAEAQIIHRNEMGANFKLERILYILDGDPLRQVTDKDGTLDAQEEIEVFNGPITPENHTLQVELVYRGNGFGAFSYMQSYRFTLNDVYTFRPEEGKRVVIKSVGYERGGVTVDVTERPAIRFDTTEVNLEDGAARPADAR